MYTHTHKHTHTYIHISIRVPRGSCGVSDNTRSLSGTYCTIPPVLLLLIITHTHTERTHTYDMGFQACRWQAAEKELKGIVCARGGEWMTKEEEEEEEEVEVVTCSQPSRLISKHKTSEQMNSVFLYRMCRTLIF